jgi:hypothetical protein
MINLGGRLTACPNYIELAAITRTCLQNIRVSYLIKKRQQCPKHGSISSILPVCSKQTRKNKNKKKPKKKNTIITTTTKQTKQEEDEKDRLVWNECYIHRNI